MQALLGIDLGTTGVKAALFAADDGRVLADAFFEYPLYHPHPGWAEQNPAEWWQATVSAICACLNAAKQHDVQPADVRGVGLSGQMHGVVLLDERQNVLRPCIIWADQRSEAQCRWMTERVGAEKLIEYVSNPALLPPVVPADAMSGKITLEVAAQTGLAVDTPVAGGGADNACGAVGNGIVAPGLALLSVGTSGIVLAYSDEPKVDTSGPVPRVHTFNHAVPHAWYLMGVTQGAGLLLRWVRDNIV